MLDVFSFPFFFYKLLEECTTLCGTLMKIPFTKNVRKSNINKLNTTGNPEFDHPHVQCTTIIESEHFAFNY